MAAPAPQPPPVRVENQEDEEAAPSNFQFTEECTPDNDAVDEQHGGCRCAAGACAAGTCPCAPANVEQAGEGRWVVLPPAEPAQDELTACGPACACYGGCGVGGGWGGTGGAPPPPVTLRKLPGKGWGVVADAALPPGLLVCHYAGEYISNAEAQRRLAEYDAAGGGHALLVLREWLPSGNAAVRVNIDATHRGNLARFFNHACDGGNLRLTLGRRTGSLLPRVLFVTSRPVAAGEELTWTYGPPNAGPGGRRCRCGTAACRGFMPHEDV